MTELPLFRMRYTRLEVRTCNEDRTQNPPHTCIEVIRWHKGVPLTLCVVSPGELRPTVRVMEPLPNDLNMETYIPFVEFAIDLMDSGGKFDVR